MSREVEEAIEKYSGALYSFVLSQTHSVQDAEDVLQEVFFLYARKSPSFKSEEQRKVWLMRAALNFCRSLRRFWRRHRTLPLDDSDVVLDGPEERELFWELDRLPEKYRATLHLFYFGGLTTEEISQTLGCSPQAVRTRLKRGRDMLRAKMDDGEDERHG